MCRGLTTWPHACPPRCLHMYMCTCSTHSNWRTYRTLQMLQLLPKLETIQQIHTCRCTCTCIYIYIHVHCIHVYTLCTCTCNYNSAFSWTQDIWGRYRVYHRGVSFILGKGTWHTSIRVIRPIRLQVSVRNLCTYTFICSCAHRDIYPSSNFPWKNSTLVVG